MGHAGLWSDIRVVGQTGSTNADVLEQARRGAPEGLVLAAEAQTAGRGRLDRVWVSRPGAALTFSVLLRPEPAPQAAWGWVPLLAGVAACRAVRAVAGIAATLKWPNDVLIGDGKLGGVLSERAGGAVVVGIGLNVAGGTGDLPVATATSLELHGAGATDRGELLDAILGELGNWYLGWRDAGGDAAASGLRAEYLRLCATVGRVVTVELPAGALAGTAAGVDESGRLLVASASGPTPVTAGDVIHVR